MNRREIIAGATALAACGPAESEATAAPFPMRRGVNLGNALEAPNEGEWGYRIETDHLNAIAAGGFDGVRVPVRWDRADVQGVGNLPLGLMSRVIDVCAEALNAGLKVQLDLHHYDAFIAAGPQSPHRAHFLAVWRRIAATFSAASDQLIFEPLNEPNGPLWTAQALRELQAEVVAIIRESNPDRLIVLGPGNWQNIDALRDWRPPEGENIAVSVHYYEPHAFTHQGAEWLGADAPRFDREWGTPADVAAVTAHIARAADWGRAHGFAMQLGEFGVNARVPLVQRAAWTRAVREACDAHGMGWCVWDFAGAFPVWDREQQAFVPELLRALTS